MSKIVVGHGLLPAIGDTLREASIRGRVHVVSDEVVFPLHGAALLSGLAKAGYEAEARVLAAGEKSKSLEQASELYDWLIDRHGERGEAILALGGGVVGDLTGFVAATYLRGVPLVQVPTTLLAQIDSSIGGKVAVDHRRGKNLIGAFYPASLVVIDVAVLGTLPRRDLVAGWAEVIKTAMILDGDLLRLLEEHRQELIDLDPGVTMSVIRRCVDHKVAVVDEDERERGRRIILNYGHTIAHALESALDYGGLLHGEAVAIGMAGAAAIAERLGLLDHTVVERQNRCLSHFGLPTHASQALATPPDESAVLSGIGLDKKVRDRAVRWVLLTGVGQVRVESDVPADVVREAVREVLQQ